MGSQLKKLRRVASLPATTIRVIGYGAPGTIKVTYANGGPPPGVYPIEALGLTISGQPPITHVHVVSREAARG
jgi:hypothetical protein